MGRTIEGESVFSVAFVCGLPHVERLLGGRLEAACTRTHHLLAQVVNLRLEAVVLGRFVLRDDVDDVTGALQCGCCLLVRCVLQVDAVHLWTSKEAQD